MGGRVLKKTVGQVGRGVGEGDPKAASLRGTSGRVRKQRRPMLGTRGKRHILEAESLRGAPGLAPPSLAAAAAHWAGGPQGGIAAGDLGPGGDTQYFHTKHT